ncbi:hypothetical protein BV22DRAFT_969026, partial [Leucogyrophana mollusca]
ATWTDADDAIMVETLRLQKLEGQQANNGWKAPVWHAVAEALQKNGHKKGAMKTAEKCSDHWTNLKANFLSVQKVRGFSGFSWDDNLKRVTAPDDVWERLASEPTTKKYERWRKAGFPLFDEILFLVEGIVATGAG